MGFNTVSCSFLLVLIARFVVGDTLANTYSHLEPRKQEDTSMRKTISNVLFSSIRTVGAIGANVGQHTC